MTSLTLSLLTSLNRFCQMLQDGVVSVEVDDFDRLQRTVFRSFRSFPLRVLDPPTAKKKRYQMPQEFMRNDRSAAKPIFSTRATRTLRTDIVFCLGVCCETWSVRRLLGLTGWSESSYVSA